MHVHLTPWVTELSTLGKHKPVLGGTDAHLVSFCSSAQVTSSLSSTSKLSKPPIPKLNLFYRLSLRCLPTTTVLEGFGQIFQASGTVLPLSPFQNLFDARLFDSLE